MNVPSSCNDYSHLPPHPVMDQESSIQRERLGYNNLEVIAMASPLALLPSSLTHTTVTATAHGTLQFYPNAVNYHSHSPYSYTQLPYCAAQAPASAQEYYFPGAFASAAAEDGMAGFAEAQLGLHLGYRSYFPARGGYAYGPQPPRCQAEGCKADLSGAKRYHRRHKVCEFHSKAAAVVTAGGLHQRFCQQCSRFHLLDEFDDAKKSCRKRLADHNRRRRKAKPRGGGADKRRSRASKAVESKAAGASSSSKNTSIGEEQQVGGSERQVTASLGDVIKEKGDHKEKASMQQEVHHQNRHGFSLASSSSSCFHQSQAVALDANTSNVAYHQEHHHCSNILQLGQAMFDLDFNN